MTTSPTDIHPGPSITETAMLEDDDQQQGDQPQTANADPLAIAQILLSTAAEKLFDHKNGGTLADKIALGHALSTFALAQATRHQASVMDHAQALHLAQLQHQPQGESRLVVPRH